MLSQVLIFGWYNKTIPGIFSYTFKVFRHILLRWLCCFVLDGVCQRSLPRMILFTRSSMEQTLQPARNWTLTWRVSLVSVKEKNPWGYSLQYPLDTRLREEPLWLLQPLGMGRVTQRCLLPLRAMEKGGTVPKAEIWGEKGAISLLTLGRWGVRNGFFFC